MSSKRKSPPTKLEGGGATNTQNNIQQSPVHNIDSSPILSNNNKSDTIPTTTTATNITTKSCSLERGTQSPANSTDIGGSEPDVDSYHSSQSPISDIDRTDDRVGIDVKVEDRANDEDEDDEAEVGLMGDNSDYDEPCKKQRLEFDTSWPISPVSCFNYLYLNVVKKLYITVIHIYTYCYGNVMFSLKFLSNFLLIYIFLSSKRKAAVKES